MHGLACRALARVSLVCLASALVAASACTRNNRDYCNTASDCPTLYCDTTTHTCGTPIGNPCGMMMCAGRNPFCLPSTKECVGCNAAMTDAGSGNAACKALSSMTPFCTGSGACAQCIKDTDCSGASPICDSMMNGGTCRACQRDSECPSLVCDPSGACVSDTSILYVSATASDCAGADGTMAKPFCKVADAVSALGSGKDTILVETGTYNENVSIGADSTVVGQSGSILKGSMGDMPVVTITSKAKVTLRGLTIENGSGTGCTASQQSGVYCDTGTQVTLLEDVLEKNLGAGLWCYQATCDVERTAAYQNGDGGAVFDSSKAATLTNDVIVHNGLSSNGTYGGVALLGTSTATIVNDTVADNTVANGAASPGIDCGTSAPQVINTIAWHDTGTTVLELSGTCKPMNDDYEMAPATSGNIATDPMFVGSGSTPWEAYHLSVMPTKSPCIGAGTASGAPSVDFDGTARPAAGPIDIGAFQD